MSKILIILSIAVLLFCVVGAYAKNDDKMDTINWNVSDGLTKTNYNDICTSYQDGYYSLWIVNGSDGELSKYKRGFEKEAETGMYKRYDVEINKFEYDDGVLGISDMVYGEYVKIGDKKYWIEAHYSSATLGDKGNVVNDLANTDLEKLRNYLTYLNEHNNATIIDVGHNINLSFNK